MYRVPAVSVACMLRLSQYHSITQCLCLLTDATYRVFYLSVFQCFSALYVCMYHVLSVCVYHTLVGSMTVSLHDVCA